MKDSPWIRGVLKTRIYLEHSAIRELLVAKTDDNLKWNMRAQLAGHLCGMKVDPKDILSMDFKDSDIPEKDFMVDVEIAYGHRLLAQFILDHKDHPLETEHWKDSFEMYCCNCKSEKDAIVTLHLDYRSLVGMKL